jgi:hypothetical protein
VEVMLHEAAHALATRRGIKDTSAAGNRYHNKRFVALAAELGLRGPDTPDKITGWSHCTLHGQAAYRGYADVVAGIDAARLPFLIDLASPARPGGGDGGSGRRRARQIRQARRAADAGRVCVPARGAPPPAHAQADRGRPDHLRPVLRPVRTARGQPGPAMRLRACERPDRWPPFSVHTPGTAIVNQTSGRRIARKTRCGRARSMGQPQRAYTQPSHSIPHW